MANAHDFMQGHLATLVVFTAMLVCGSVIWFARFHPRLAGRTGDTSAVQAMHTRHTPRIGGVGIFAALIVSAPFAPVIPALTHLYFAFAGSILFLVALLEDIGCSISPRRRLLAAAIASLAVIFLFDAWIPRADIPIFDIVFSTWVVGIPMTVLVVCGVANGFNLIDGVNGLASFTGIVSALALAMIANAAGVLEMAYVANMLALAIAGFFVLNYPLGLIFLGDAGAYMIGFVLSWIGIYLLNINEDVTPWAILLTVFWPVADMALVMYRRKRRKRALMVPDRMHTHQVVLRCLEICLLGRGRRNIANPLTCIVLAPFVAAPPLAAVLVWDKPLLAFICLAGFGVTFVLSLTAANRLVRSRSFARSRAAVSLRLFGQNPVKRKAEAMREPALGVAGRKVRELQGFPRDHTQDEKDEMQRVIG